MRRDVRRTGSSSGWATPAPTTPAPGTTSGYLVADELADRMGGSWKAHKSGRADVVEGRLGGLPGLRASCSAGPRSLHERVRRTGRRRCCNFYKVEPERLDRRSTTSSTSPYGDAAGQVRWRRQRPQRAASRSARSLGTGDYYRVRVGVGRPPGRQDPADFVLRDFSSAERKELDLQVDRAADAVESLITDGLERTQNHYNAMSCPVSSRRRLILVEDALEGAVFGGVVGGVGRSSRPR